MKHRLFIVEDHSIVRRGLREILEEEPDFVICGEAEHASQALEAIQALRPDVVLCDLSLKGMNGLDLTKQLSIVCPEAPVLIISFYDEQFYAVRALRAGARGYLMKQKTEQEIVHAIRRILDGQYYFSTEVLEKGAMASAKNGEMTVSIDPIARLTDREFEVFLLIGQGYAPRHIAERLNLSVHTIEVYRQRLKDKLNLDSTADLQRYAVQWGLPK